jgi:hypothetical protein
MLALNSCNEAFPMMSDGELEELAEDIKAVGLLVPIILDKNGVLLDGKCRLRACEIAGIEPTFKTFEGDEDECKALIWSLNGIRQSFSSSQRAVASALSAAASPGGHWEPRVVPEARAVAQHRDLADTVMAGAIPLSVAYEGVLERKRGRVCPSGLPPPGGFSQGRTLLGHAGG